MDPITQLREEIRGLVANIDEAIAPAQSENRALTDDERKTHDELVAKHDDYRSRLTVLEDQKARTDEVAEARKGQPASIATVTHEPLTYEKGNKRSYFLDLARSQVQGDQDARERIAAHRDEMAVEMPKREARRAAKAEQELRNFEGSSFEKRVNPSRVTGQGGEFVPPLWLVDEYAAYLRAGRTTADLCRKMTLPEGTDSINLPKVASGSSTAVQTDLGAVSSTDITTTSVQANVRTIAGQQDVGLQLIEQSPVSFDEVIFADLIADYNRMVDIQVLRGTGAGGVGGGQLLGLDNVTGVNAVTYTDGTPTLGKAYVPIGQGASQVAENRFAPVQQMVMHPRRWYWALTQLDSQNRPLVVPSVNDAYNPIGVQEGIPVQGPAGNIAGIPTYLDPNITITDGGGTNQDRIYEIRGDDMYLWEGALRTRAMPEVLSGTMQVRLQVYNYVAFMPHRYPVSTAIIAGTGLIGPSGF